MGLRGRWECIDERLRTVQQKSALLRLVPLNALFKLPAGFLELLNCFLHHIHPSVATCKVVVLRYFIVALTQRCLLEKLEGTLRLISFVEEVECLRI